MPKEHYTGVKYTLICTAKESPEHENLPELKHYCAQFQEKEYAPLVEGSSAGNLSFRISKGVDAFIITCSHTALRRNMPNEDFAVVCNISLEANETKAVCVRAPSSESLMHGAIYRARPDINAVFHGHSDLFLKYADTLNLPVTEQEQPYGTPELVCEIFKFKNNPNFVILKNHGFVAMGEDMQDAFNIITQLEQKIMALK